MPRNLHEHGNGFHKPRDLHGNGNGFQKPRDLHGNGNGIHKPLDLHGNGNHKPLNLHEYEKHRWFYRFLRVRVSRNMEDFINIQLQVLQSVESLTAVVLLKVL